MIRLIASIDDKRGLTREGQTPWRIPNDFRYFREQTIKYGATVLMGRKTYEVIGHPLPHRRNLVATTALQAVDGCEVVRDAAALLRSATDDLWVVGGTLFGQALPYADELYITHVSGDYQCDTFFPDYKNFILKSEGEMQEQDGYLYKHNVYVRA